VKELTEDSDFIVRAAALNGLHLDLVASPERLRIATLLATAARTLRRRLLSLDNPTEWDLSLAHRLPELEMWMEGIEEQSM
jgi:hypothetical protein